MQSATVTNSTEMALLCNLVLHLSINRRRRQPTPPPPPRRSPALSPSQAGGRASGRARRGRPRDRRPRRLGMRPRASDVQRRVPCVSGTARLLLRMFTSVIGHAVHRSRCAPMDLVKGCPCPNIRPPPSPGHSHLLETSVQGASVPLSTVYTALHYFIIIIVIIITYLPI